MKMNRIKACWAVGGGEKAGRTSELHRINKNIDFGFVREQTLRASKYLSRKKI